MTNLHPVAGGADVEFDDGTTLRAGWVVGSDGAHSQVRSDIGIEFPGVPIVERFLLADVHVDLGLPRDAVAVWLRGAQMLAAFPLPGADLWRLMAPAPEGTDVRNDNVLDELVNLLADNTGTTPLVRGCDWTSTFRIHRRLAATYRRGHVLLAGDAAHIHSPFGGQGMNTGLGDAENLAWKLGLVVRGLAGESLLDTYEAERRPVAEEVLASTSSLTGLVLGGNAAARLLRDRVLVPLMNAPLVQRLIWEQASQLKVSYRKGPLGGRSWRRGSRPGDRIADVPAVTEAGRSTRLHAELGAARWVVLAPSTLDGSACAALAWRHLGDDRVTLLVSPEPCDRIRLVRPDAHLAWSGSDPGSLERWLTSTLDAPLHGGSSDSAQTALQAAPDPVGVVQG
jgi:4,5-epoxidase